MGPQHTPPPTHVSSRESDAPETLRELPSTRSLAKRAWGIFKKRAVTAGTFIAAGAFATAFIGTLFFLTMRAMGPHVALAPSLAITFIALLLNIAVAIICGAALLTALVRHEENENVYQVLRIGARRALPFFWTYLLFLLAYWTGSILLVIPGIIFAVACGYGLLIAITEKQSGITALTESAALTKGHRLAVFGRSLLSALALFVLLLLAFAPSAFARNAAAGTLGAFLSLAVLLAGAVYLIAFQVAIFDALRAVKANTPEKPGRKWGIIALCVGAPVIALLSGAVVFHSFNAKLANLNTTVEDMQRLLDVTDIQVSLEEYADKHDAYPTTLDALTGDGEATSTPRDPTGAAYQYTTGPNERSFTLCANMIAYRGTPPQPQNWDHRYCVSGKLGPTNGGALTPTLIQQLDPTPVIPRS